MVLLIPKDEPNEAEFIQSHLREAGGAVELAELGPKYLRRFGFSLTTRMFENAELERLPTLKKTKHIYHILGDNIVMSNQ